MAKKTTLLLSIFAVMFLVACEDTVNQENNDSPVVNETTNVNNEVVDVLPDFEMTIREITADELESLPDALIFDYGFRTDFYATLLFNFNQDVRNVTIYRGELAPFGGYPYAIVEYHHDFELIEANSNFVIDYFLWSGGSMPAHFLSFTTADGQIHWYYFDVSRMSGDLTWHAFEVSDEFTMFDLRHDSLDEIEQWFKECASC